jgi:RNA polymerase sigma-70 factor, ECF subfamily
MTFRSRASLQPPLDRGVLRDFITIERGDILKTTALEVEDGRVVAVYVVRNPDKLRHMADTLH